MLLIAVWALVAACSLLPPGAADDIGERPLPYPEGCAAFELSARRCDHIVNTLGERLGVDRSRVKAIQLLGDPGCGADAPEGELCERTMSFVVRVRFIRDDGRVAEDSQFCGIDSTFLLGCTEEPRIDVITPLNNGYGDIPCSGEPPDGCASPVATMDPAVAGDARPLSIASMDIPLDHVGAYDIPLGTAVLANGLLTETGLTLADPIQSDFVLGDGLVWLLVIGPDGEQIQNIYMQGWRPGTETVDVRLAFDVAAADPGAMLRVRDVVVR